MLAMMLGYVAADQEDTRKLSAFAHAAVPLAIAFLVSTAVLALVSAPAVTEFVDGPTLRVRIEVGSNSELDRIFI